MTVWFWRKQLYCIVLPCITSGQAPGTTVYNPHSNPLGRGPGGEYFCGLRKVSVTYSSWLEKCKEKKSILSLRAVRRQAGGGQMAMGYSSLNPAEA